MFGEARDGSANFVALRIELLRLFERIARCACQAERVLATSKLQPEQEVARIQFERLLKQLQRKGEVLVVIANPRGQPRDEPIAGREEHSFLKTIIGARFLPGQQHITTGQPYIGSIAALLDG